MGMPQCKNLVSFRLFIFHMWISWGILKIQCKYSFYVQNSSIYSDIIKLKVNAIMSHPFLKKIEMACGNFNYTARKYSIKA